MLQRGPIAACLIIAVFAGATTWARPLNLYEWSAVAPVVVAAEVMLDEGRYTRVLVLDAPRGPLQPGDEIRVHLRRANLDRDRDEDLRALRLDPGHHYLMLLERETRRKPPKPGLPPAFSLVRGVEGARELPAEGAQAVLDALRGFTRIQDEDDDRAVWRELEAMLQATNPIMIEVALEQFLRFRRGDADMLPLLRPLLDHPAEDTRENAARLIALVLEQFPVVHEDRGQIQSELAARARRDTVARVRIAATEALDALDTDSVESILQEIARTDPDQDVRYTAERLMYDRRGASD